MIHQAAREGHEAVVKMLVNEFHVKPDATNNVRTVSEHINTSMSALCGYYYYCLL